MGVQAFRYPYLGIYVNSFCLDAGETDILIDSGLVSGRKHLAPFAKKTTALLCTHGHWDHIGNHRFLQEGGALVYAHPGDLRYLQEHDWHWQVLFGQFEDDFDLPPARRTAFVEEIGAPVTPDRLLQDGEMLRFGGLTVEVIATPGHSDGSVCFLVRETGDLFTGDTLMGNGFFSGIPQYTDSLAYRLSMERLSSISAERIWCDHNDPLPGSALAEKAKQGIACCERLERHIRSFVGDYQGSPDLLLREAVKSVCAAENKNAGGGACVTVLTHLKEMGEDERLSAVIGKHIPL